MDTKKTVTVSKNQSQLSAFALLPNDSILSLVQDINGNSIRIPQMRVNVSNSRIRTVWQQPDTEKDILIVGVDLTAVEALENSGLDISTITPISVVLPLDASDGKLKELVKNQKLKNIEFVGFKATPSIQRNGNFSSLTINYSADDVRVIEKL